VRTYCRICEAACGLIAETSNGRVTGLKPDREHPVSRGFVCAKGTRFHEVAAHPDRLLHPVVDGRRASWETALQRAGSEIRRIREEHGPHAVGLYFGNPIAFNALGAGALLLFMKALGTRNVFAAGSQDCNNKFAGGEIVHGSPVVHPIPDLEHTRLAVFFGSNPAVSQSSFVHLPGGSRVFDELVSRGGRAIFVDPRRTESGSRWEHLPIRAGADLWLILALLNLLDRGRAQADGLDEMRALARGVDLARAARITGLKPSEIEDLATSIRQAGRVAFHMSVGVNQGPFGTLTYVALQALMFATGNLDRRGGSVLHPLAPVAGRLAKRLHIGTSQARSRIGGHRATLDTLPAAILADEIRTPGDKVRALIVIAGNPVSSVPGGHHLREALGDLELLVGIDLFANNTLANADVLLPTTSWLERWDVAGTTSIFQTGGRLQSAQAVVDPPGETRHEPRILADLAAAAGLPLFKSRRVTRVVRAMPWSRLPTGMWPIPSPRPGHWGGTFTFWHPDLAVPAAKMAEVEAELIAPGFTLIGRRRRIGHNSWLHRGSHDGRARRHAWLAPEDLESLGIGDGDPIEIRTDAGQMIFTAAADDGLKPGTVAIPHGLPGASINDLIPADRIDPLSGQLWMSGLRVDVTPAREPASPA